MAMTISLSDAGKRYNREWIFRHVNYSFEEGKSYAVTGPNGSGKSTLLQALAGSLHINEGTIQYSFNGTVVKDSAEPDNNNPKTANKRISSIQAEGIYQYISICAPYL